MDQETARCMSTNRILRGNMEKDDSPGKSKKPRDVLDFSVGIIDATMDLGTFGYANVYLPVNGGRYLMTVVNHNSQTAHNSSEVLEGQSPIIRESVRGRTFLASLHCIKNLCALFHGSEVNRAHLLHREEVIIPALFYCCKYVPATWRI